MSIDKAIEFIDQAKKNICNILEMSRKELEIGIKEATLKTYKIEPNQVWGLKSNDKFLPGYVVVLYNQPYLHDTIVFYGFFESTNIPKHNVLTRDKFLKNYTYLPFKKLAFINKVED